MTAGSVPTSPTVGSMWRSTRGILLVAVLVVVGAAVPVLLTGPPASTRYLDPADSSLEGGAALAALLRERGVHVERVETVEDALLHAGYEDVVLVSRPDTLTTSDAQRLVSSGRDLLVAGPIHVETLAPGAEVAARPAPGAVEPRCDLPAATRAGVVDLGGSTFVPAPGMVPCYPVDGRPSLVRGPEVTVLGSGEFMTNRRLDHQGNAALALNLAGQAPQLAWLAAPDLDAALPADGDRQGLMDLVPVQVPWAVAALVLGVLLAALWRGRRLGPVVTERLPVVVRAAETVEGRGRLYRARGAREQAARALRAATAARVAALLGSTGTADTDAIAVAAADRIGQDAAQVRRLLDGPAPADDRALVRLAHELDALEREVRDR